LGIKTTKICRPFASSGVDWTKRDATPTSRLKDHARLPGDSF